MRISYGDMARKTWRTKMKTKTNESEKARAVRTQQTKALCASLILAVAFDLVCSTSLSAVVRAWRNNRVADIQHAHGLDMATKTQFQRARRASTMTYNTHDTPQPV